MLNEFEVLPVEESETIPAEWYTGQDFYNLEKESIFMKSWQYVCSAGRFEQPGDCKVEEINGKPVILVLGEDKKLRAFYNVCRHRAGPIADKDCKVKILQCRYHGWRYRLDGNLLGTTEFDGVKNFNSEEFSLFEIKTEVWENMVFINFDKNPVPLSNYLDGIMERVAPIRLDKAKFHSRVSYKINCNWKVYVDNFLEGYHLPYVHPKLNKMLDYKNYKTELSENYSLQYSPVRAEENIYGTGNDEAFYYFIYPNIMLNILPGRLQTNSVIPLSVNKTGVVFDYYYQDTSSPEALKIIAEDINFSDEVQYEDIRICEKVQKGLESGVYNKGRFSPSQETGVHHFQSLLKRGMRES